MYDNWVEPYVQAGGHNLNLPKYPRGKSKARGIILKSKLASPVALRGVWLLDYG